MDELELLRWANVNMRDTLTRLRRWAVNDPTGPVDAHGVSKWVVSVIDHGLTIGDPAMLSNAPNLAPAKAPGDGSVAPDEHPLCSDCDCIQGECDCDGKEGRPLCLNYARSDRDRGGDSCPQQTKGNEL